MVRFTWRWIRTNWRLTDLMVVSLIYDKRAIPIYIQILNKQGSSNLEEQKQVLEPVIRLLKDYTIIILGNREFCSIKLGNSLQRQSIRFALRLKKNENIQQDSDFIKLNELAYRKRFDIEEMFRDFKSGGYHLEDTRVTGDRLIGTVSDPDSGLLDHHDRR